MKNRLISLLLVAMMLLGMVASFVSCAQLEEFVGLENMDQEYLEKYHPELVGNSGNKPGSGNNPGSGDEEAGEQVPNTHKEGTVQRDGYNYITFFWYNKNADMKKCDIWVWWDGQDGKGWEWTLHDNGYYCATFEVPENVAEVGFIPRKDCTEPFGSSWGSAQKDCGEDDLFATIEGKDTFIYLKGGKNDPNQYHSNDGGKTLKVIQKFNLAGMVSQNTLEYYVTPAVKLNRLSQVKVYDEDGNQIEVTGMNRLNKSSASGQITVNAELDVTKIYTLEIEGYGQKAVSPTKIFDTEYFAKNFHYDGDDLGATLSADGKSTTFKVWAPTASKVVLNLYKDGQGGFEPINSPEDQHIDMTRGDKGVWYYTAECGHGTYYTYTVTTSVGTQEAVDPYAKSAGINGDRGMVIDLDSTDPEGWATDKKPFSIDSYSDAIIWEIHIRDFSNLINFGSDEKNDEYQGKYLAFTQEGLVNAHGEKVGIDYLKALGVNYVHLLPSYDYATVNEGDPDSGFNWGYDPKNYNVPEGSYSSDPRNGAVRVTEYKQMVQALHEAGIGVIMDVVYNHTYDKNASFNRIVPYYYYRYKANGANSSGSGCGNDTASERYMYGKFMVESISYWQQEYHLDGFRFDLMGLHDLDTMQEVEKVVHTYDREAILYGEGWEMMKNAYGGAIPAHQGNISRIKASNGAIGTIAVFNDTMRVGLKGESDDASKGYISGNQSKFKRVQFGVLGGVSTSYDSWWKVDNDMVVNYLSAHDNSTLWDKLAISNKSDSVDQRLKMNRLGATILFMSEGVVFFQAGEEMLRTKPNAKSPNGFDHNSYKSSDEVNNLKWDTLDGKGMYSQMVNYYAGLCAIRTKMDIFTNHTSFDLYTHQGNSGFNIVMNDGKGGVAIAVFNPHAYGIKFTPQGANIIICDGTRAGITSLGTANGEITIPGYSAMIFVNAAVLNGAGK